MNGRQDPTKIGSHVLPRAGEGVAPALGEQGIPVPPFGIAGVIDHGWRLVPDIGRGFSMRPGFSELQFLLVEALFRPLPWRLLGPEEIGCRLEQDQSVRALRVRGREHARDESILVRREDRGPLDADLVEQDDEVLHHRLERPDVVGRGSLGDAHAAHVMHDEAPVTCEPSDEAGHHRVIPVQFDVRHPTLQIEQIRRARPELLISERDVAIPDEASLRTIGHFQSPWEMTPSRRPRRLLRSFGTALPDGKATGPWRNGAADRLRLARATLSRMTESGRRTNRLADETSPYLLQHAHNPVDWHPWGPEALETARAQDRPIFLSIGYSACHWCHVMERESFENPEIAALMNEHFVSIKVDREERPDLDDVYMAAVQAMTGSGGWPMSVFLTPDLRPFFGGTYFPPDDRHGMAGFPRVLAAVADAYRSRRDRGRAAGRRARRSSAGAAVGALRRSRPGAIASSMPPPRASVPASTPCTAGSAALRSSRRPMALEFLLRSWRRSGDPAILAMVTRTLDAMADGGINDQLGGGFARYSTDAHWLVPHFEKMLYDNALLAHAYLEGYRATGNERYAQVARATLDFMLAELLHRRRRLRLGARRRQRGRRGPLLRLVPRLSSWPPFPTRASIPTRCRMLAEFWGVTAAGNWEGTNVLHRTGTAEPPPGLVERGRTALLAARSRRVRPARDDKQLAAWNGLALRALGHATLVLDDPRYAAATRALVAFIETQLVREGDRLWRTARDGRAHTPAFCEDYLAIADGLLTAHAALGEPAPLQLARRLVATALARVLGPRRRHVRGHLVRARADRRAAPRPGRQRHAIGEQPGRRRAPAPGAADRRRDARRAGRIHPARGGSRPGAPAERVRPNALRGRSAARRADRRGGGRRPAVR